MNLINNLNLQKQQMNYQMNQNIKPSYANTENNQIPAQYMNNMGNYHNITQRMNINKGKTVSPNYNAPMSSHIKNKAMENMNNNFGIQFTKTPKKNNNSYVNKKLGIGNNQLYNYPNSQNI